MWYLFEYESGANPYIAKTEAERDRIIHKYRRKNINVCLVSCFSATRYRVFDKEDEAEQDFPDIDEEEDFRSVTGGDYGAGSPWNAPGMSARDFI